VRDGAGGGGLDVALVGFGVDLADGDVRRGGERPLVVVLRDDRDPGL
jgi:hypothetical protein